MVPIVSVSEKADLPGFSERCEKQKKQESSEKNAKTLTGRLWYLDRTPR